MEIEIKEEWKDIPGYEGIYQASNLGSIKSLNYWKTGKEKNLKLMLYKDGYYKVNLAKNGINKPFNVHQLVAITFLEHKPDKWNLVIDHINSNSKDNRVENLKIVTHRENTSKERVLKSGLPVGIYYHKHSKKFLVRIRIKNERKYLGLFNTAEEASEAYQNELQKVEQK